MTGSSPRRGGVGTVAGPDRRSVPVALGAPIAVLASTMLASLITQLPTRMLQVASALEGVAVVAGSFALVVHRDAARRLLWPLRGAALLYLAPVAHQLLVPPALADTWTPTLLEVLLHPLWFLWLPVAAVVAAREAALPDAAQVPASDDAEQPHDAEPSRDAVPPPEAAMAGAGRASVLVRSWSTTARWGATTLVVSLAAVPYVASTITAGGDVQATAPLLFIGSSCAVATTIHGLIAASRAYRVADDPDAVVRLRPGATLVTVAMLAALWLATLLEVVRGS